MPSQTEIAHIASWEYQSTSRLESFGSRYGIYQSSYAIDELWQAKALGHYKGAKAKFVRTVQCCEILGL